MAQGVETVVELAWMWGISELTAARWITDWLQAPPWSDILPEPIDTYELDQWWQWMCAQMRDATRATAQAEQHTGSATSEPRYEGGRASPETAAGAASVEAAAAHPLALAPPEEDQQLPKLPAEVWAEIVQDLTPAEWGNLSSASKDLHESVGPMASELSKTPQPGVRLAFTQDDLDDALSDPQASTIKLLPNEGTQFTVAKKPANGKAVIIAYAATDVSAGVKLYAKNGARITGSEPRARINVRSDDHAEIIARAGKFSIFGRARITASGTAVVNVAKQGTAWINASGSATIWVKGTAEIDVGENARVAMNTSRPGKVRVTSPAARVRVYRKGATEVDIPRDWERKCVEEISSREPSRMTREWEVFLFDLQGQ